MRLRIATTVAAVAAAIGVAAGVAGPVYSAFSSHDAPTVSVQAGRGSHP